MLMRPSWVPRARFYRQYSEASLWATLMEVSSGESVYKASRKHGVPEKTVRDWMKRLNIQSQFSAPYLKRAAARAAQQSPNAASERVVSVPVGVDANDDCSDSA